MYTMMKYISCVIFELVPGQKGARDRVCVVYMPFHVLRMNESF